MERELDAKGYRRSPTGAPDFWVLYGAAIRQKSDYSKLNGGSGYAPAWGRGLWADEELGKRGLYVRTYEEGTLIIDVVDAATSRLVWRGSAQAEVSGTNTERKKEARLRSAVRRILARFPPR